MSPRVVTGLEDLRALVGTELGTSEWRQITQEQVDLFADATDDHQWIHVDVERAAASPQGGTIAHGHLTLSLFPAFAREIVSVEFGSARLNYGVDSVRFPSPVPVGARVRATGTLVAVEEVPAGVRITTRYVVEVEGQERPACVGDAIALVRR